MSTFSWALLVVGLFLVLYAALTLARVGRDGNGRRQSLGCGFALLAAVIWGLAFARYIGDWWAGVRLGFAFALLLPALVTLFNPGRGGIATAVVLLALSVILGASAVPALWARVQPGVARSRLQRVEDAIHETRNFLAATQAQISELHAEETQLKERIKDRGHKDFDALAEDPVAYGLLEELAQVRQLSRDAEARLEALESDLARLQAVRRRLERMAEARHAGADISDEEVANILDESPSGLRPPQRTVEEHLEREELRDLFEEQF